MPALTATRQPMIPAVVARVVALAVGSGVAVAHDPTITAAVITVVGGFFTLVTVQLLQLFIANRREHRRADLKRALVRERRKNRHLEALLREQEQGRKS